MQLRRRQGGACKRELRATVTQLWSDRLAVIPVATDVIATRHPGGRAQAGEPLGSHPRREPYCAIPVDELFGREQGTRRAAFRRSTL
ncbi:MAG: hypothetical protein OXG15_09250 [Gammaproteobacteria bacterium]|nr:hypothetical protein [Gammaproteobacteria bacterium]